MEARKQRQTRVIGRYVLCDEIAAGGMATVHFGRLVGPVGFSRTVAIKQLHPQYAKDPEFVSMFLDEARLAARIRHPNVVQTLDIVATAGELFLVMDYVQGESLSRLLRASREQPIAPRVLGSIACGALLGLHAAHEATDEHGDQLGIVHRDVSPQNLLVGSDGIVRVLDFGVAKAAGRVQTTKAGHVKGKIGYMAPEQIQGEVTRQCDVFAMGVILWEAFARRRLFTGNAPAEIMHKVIAAPIAPPGSLVSDVPPGVDRILMRALDRDLARRYPTAREMAVELEECLGVASPTQVGTWVDSLAHAVLARRAAAIAEIESASSHVVDRSVAAVLGRESAPSPDATAAPMAAVGVTLSDPPPGAAVSASRVIAPPRSRRLAVAAVAFACLAALVAGGALIARQRAHHVVLAAAASAPAIDAPVPPPVAATAAAEPVAAAPAETTPPAVASPVSATAAPRPAPLVSRPALPIVRPRAAVDCDPPYALDGQGHKQWKAACFAK